MVLKKAYQRSENIGNDQRDDHEGQKVTNPGQRQYDSKKQQEQQAQW